MRKATVLLLAALLALPGPLPALAADEALSATPPVGEVSVLPGATATETVTLTNGTNETLSVLAAVGDVRPFGNGFELLAPGSTADSAAAWVTVTPAGLDLAPGGSATVSVSVRAPGGVPPGEHAAGVLFSSGRRAQALHTLIVEVGGSGVRRDAKVTRIEMPSFTTKDRIPFRITVENAGNTHAVISGTITIRDRLRRTTTNIAIPTFYAMPGRSTAFIIEWDAPPPLLLARVTAEVALRYESASRPGGTQSVSTTGVAIIYWAFALLVALVLLIIRLLIGFVARRRRRERRAKRHERITAERMGVTLPTPVQGSPAAPAPSRTGRSAWDGDPDHSAAVGAIAVRRAHVALSLLRQGAGKSGVRTDVAVGLLRSVSDLPEVRREIEVAYEAAAARNAVREAGALALGLAAVESPQAPEALLRGYAKADRVLAARLKRALSACDPADLRAHPDLLEALPHTRREALPVG